MTDHCPRIAIIDDDRSLTEGLRRNIARLRPDWELETYNDPIEFINFFEDGAYDAIVSDMRMPGLSGLELIGQVQKTSTVACIILTGTPDLMSAMCAINDANVFRYYTKPCKISLLVQGIEEAVGTSFRGSQQAKRSGSADEKDYANFAQEALNQLALGVAVVDQHGHVLYTNQSAASILAADDGLGLNRANQCRATTSEVSTALLDLIRNTLTREELDSEDPAALSVERPSMLRPYCVFVAPIGSAERAGPDEKLAAMFISDPEQMPVPAIDQIVTLYGLSRSQAIIVRSLAFGMKVEDAAREAGITVSTARTYLKLIFSKTETSRQSELLKLVLSVPRVKAA